MINVPHMQCRYTYIYKIEEKKAEARKDLHTSIFYIFKKRELYSIAFLF